MAEMSSAPRERLCTAGEIADLLSVTTKWVYSACRLYDMPHYRVGAYLRFSPKEVFEWIRETGTTRHSIAG